MSVFCHTSVELVQRGESVRHCRWCLVDVLCLWSGSVAIACDDLMNHTQTTAEY